MAYLREQTEEMPIEHEISLRLLQHFTSSVRHQQYHDADIVTVRVEAPVGDMAFCVGFPASLKERRRRINESTERGTTALAVHQRISELANGVLTDLEWLGGWRL